MRRAADIVSKPCIRNCDPAALSLESSPSTHVFNLLEPGRIAHPLAAHHMIVSSSA